MKIRLILIFSVLISGLLRAQQIHVNGIVLDSITHQPVPYATVRCPMLLKTSAANARGEFEILAQSNDPIIISSVGYKSKSLAAQSGNHVILYLAPTVTEIEEVVVFASKPSEEARKIVKKAFEHLRKNTGPFTAVADLRHAIKVNDRYVKMMDAEVIIRDDKKYQGNLRPEFVQEEIVYQQKRESLDFAIDRVDFQRSYFDFYFNEFAFLLKNGLKYSLTSREYDYFLEEATEFPDETRYKISAFDKTIANSTFTEIFDITYEILVSKSTDEHFIRSYELNYKSVTLRKFITHTENSFFKIQLRKSDGRFIPEAIENFLIQTTRHDSLSKPDEVEAFHHMSFTPIVATKSSPAKNIQYSADYWADKPIDSKLQNDLSLQIDLEKQFSFQHILSEKMSNQEKVSKALVDKYMEDNKHCNIYLVLWEKPEAIITFINAPDFIDHRKTRPIFIGAVESFRDWAFIIEGNGTMYYPHFNLPTLIKSYMPSSIKLPAYVLNKPSGERIQQATPIEKKHLEK